MSDPVNDYYERLTGFADDEPDDDNRQDFDDDPDDFFDYDAGKDW